MYGLESMIPEEMRHFDKYGNEVTEEYWKRLIKFRAYRIVKQEWVGNKFVSTCWLTTEYFPNMFFETLVFDVNKEEECRRYTTLEEAEIGHDNLVKEMKNEPRA